MKTLIAYRFTGETKESLEKLIFPINDALKGAGIKAYCTFFDKNLAKIEKTFKPQDYTFYAFKLIDNIDFLFTVLNSDDKSEGMILEIGYCIGKNIPVIVAVKEGVTKTYLPGMASTVINWKDVEDLTKKISKFDFKKFKK